MTIRAAETITVGTATGFDIIDFNDSHAHGGWEDVLSTILNSAKESKVPHNKILIREGETVK